MAEAWEPSKKQYSFRNRGALDRKALFTPPPLILSAGHFTATYGTGMIGERGLNFELTAEDKLVTYISITAKNKVCNIPH